MANMKLLLAFTLLCSTACSVNMIWISTAYPECTSCLDETYLSCPGYYQDLSYAECMCKGDGGVNLATCVGVCDSVDTLGTALGSQAVGAWYLYCTVFFKEMCPAAEPFMDSEFYETRCGPDSGPGLGDSVAPSATSSTGGATTGTTIISPSVTRVVSGTAAPTGAASTSQSNAALTGAATTSPSNAAALMPNPLPRWSFIIGLGIQLAGMNM